MSYKNDHSIKKENCLKDVNLPIFLTNNGSPSTNNDQTWAYQRAPDCQINLIENKQLHEDVHRQRKPNALYFELLPNELIQDLFEYLPVIDLVRSFYYLNQRFHHLVQYKLTEQARLRLDFSSLSVREYDFISSHFNPKQVEALTLGDCDMNRVNEPSSFGQIALFLYRYHLSQFPSLKSLRIIEPYDYNQLTLLLNQLPENQLKHLRIAFRTRSQKDLLFCLPFMDTLESISLDQVTLTDSSKLLEMSFKQLQYLYVNDISEVFLLSLLSRMCRLRYLNVRLISNPAYEDILFISHNECELLNLTTLSVESYKISWKVIELNLLSHMRNLRRLSLVGDYKTSVFLLADQWKECFLTYTPYLTDFRFYINIPLEQQLSKIDEILKPFYEEFWQKRKWYAAVDVEEKKNIHLYSLPCPHLHQLLKINCRVENRLTTLPASSEISHSYFDGITSVVISGPDQNTETSTTPIFYRNIRSLIINRNDSYRLLHRLVYLSSIHELTLSDTIDYMSFINLLNMMTRLESLRLMEESHKILLLLKENRSLMECLQKRAIRKLYLRNHYSIKDLTNNTVFPIDEFIQVFGNSLEFLYWRKPSVSIPIESIINNLPKLKSLTIIKNSNKRFSTNELTQWMQANTRLKTFVIKCENGINDDIWHFWL